MGNDFWASAVKSLKRDRLASDAELEHAKKKQGHLFRLIIFSAVVLLMLVEVAGMFVIVALQGFGGVPGVEGFEFELDRWVLAAFEAGILLQTFALAKIITLHLFPDEAKAKAEKDSGTHE